MHARCAGNDGFGHIKTWSWNFCQAFFPFHSSAHTALTSVITPSQCQDLGTDSFAWSKVQLAGSLPGPNCPFPLFPPVHPIEKSWHPHLHSASCQRRHLSWEITGALFLTSLGSCDWLLSRQTYAGQCSRQGTQHYLFPTGFSAGRAGRVGLSHCI